MNTKSENTISIITPVYNEILGIEKLMENLDKFKDRAEIIFIDGGSTDGTDLIIKNSYNIYYSKKKGRGYQMNYGASLAKGDILLFLHGDNLLPENALEEIDKMIYKNYKVGAFKLKFLSNHILMKICGFMSNMRIKYRNIAFGDQGIFITKEYFNYLGGFKELPLMEDYQLSIDIKNDGEKFALVNSKIMTSDRRFRKNGILKTMARMQRLQYMYRKNVDIDLIANLYK